MKVLWLIALASVAAQAQGAGTGHYAPVNDLKMYYEVHGRDTPGGTTLVLLHGGSDTIETRFAQLLPMLAASRRVIAVEQQGHGHTADIDRPLSYQQMADDTAALLESLKVGKADLLGFSDGGNVALQVAIRHPGLVRKLIASGSNYRADGMTEETVAWTKAATPESLGAAAQAAYESVAPDPKHWGPLIRKLRQMWLEAQYWSDEEMKSIRAPVLLMYGDRDAIKVEHGVRIQHLIQNSQLAVLPGTSHSTVTEQPRWVLAMATAFLDAPLPNQK